MGTSRFDAAQCPIIGRVGYMQLITATFFECVYACSNIAVCFVRFNVAPNFIAIFYQPIFVKLHAGSVKKQLLFVKIELPEKKPFLYEHHWFFGVQRRMLGE
jgi:hypothetical protein